MAAGGGGALREAAAAPAGSGDGPFGSSLWGLLFASTSCAKIVYPKLEQPVRLGNRQTVGKKTEDHTKGEEIQISSQSAHCDSGR